MACVTDFFAEWKNKKLLKGSHVTGRTASGVKTEVGLALMPDLLALLVSLMNSVTIIFWLGENISRLCASTTCEHVPSKRKKQQARQTRRIARAFARLVLKIQKFACRCILT